MGLGSADSVVHYLWVVPKAAGTGLNMYSSAESSANAVVDLPDIPTPPSPRLQYSPEDRKVLFQVFDSDCILAS